MCQSLYPYGKNSTHLFDLGGYRSHIGATSVSSNLAQLKLPQHLQAKNVYLKLYLEFFFFNWDSLYARPNSHYKAWSYKKKKHKKIKAYQKSLQKEPTDNRCLLILDLKPLRL